MLASGDLDERHDAVGSQVRIDGHGIGMPRGLERTSHRNLAKISAGVGLGRGTDIVAFAVEDDEESVSLGVLDGGMEGGEPLRAEGFVECRLKLDRGHDRCDDIDHLAAEGAKCGADARQIVRELLHEPRGKFFRPGVDAHEDRVSLLSHGLDQVVSKVHESALPTSPD